MDHGSHTFYLAFDWLKSYPTSISANATTLGSFDTEDNLSCTMKFPEGLATAELSWTAGVRKVIYTVHGDRGALRVEDDDLEINTRRSTADGHVIIQETSRQRITSDWGDASHSKWFGSLFAQFARSVRGEEDTSRDLEDALRCVEVIAAAYASAADGSREHALPAAHSQTRLSM